MRNDPERPCIVVAGASGYIGKAIIPSLLEKFPNATIIALSRSQQESDDPRIQWKACDLFSLKSLEAALPPAVDLAYYLVHSMGPTAQLDQGSFADYDLLLADNFARAIKATGARQVIYLGGLVPSETDDGDRQQLSLHLRSRLEVEETFSEHGLPITIFRAGLVLGEAGSSFQILLKLVERLPIMVCPSWTQTLTTPVDLPTVLAALVTAALELEHVGRVYDLAGCRPLSYIRMMRETARRLGKRRYFLTVPFFTPTLSRLWVSLITNTPKNLVYPLVESLEHAMVAREEHFFSTEWSQRTYSDLLENASMKTHAGRSLFRFRAAGRTVRSVQRLPLAAGRDAAWTKDRYFGWLPRFLAPLIKVRVDGTTAEFSLLARRPVLLRLKLSEERSDPDRQLLYITGGWLAGRQNVGRLEFRVVLGRRFTIAAIHEYRPALPWFVYKFTQAQVHLLVMRAFGRSLS